MSGRRCGLVSRTPPPKAFARRRSDDVSSDELDELFRLTDDETGAGGVERGVAKAKAKSGPPAGPPPPVPINAPDTVPTPAACAKAWGAMVPGPTHAPSGPPAPTGIPTGVPFMPFSSINTTTLGPTTTSSHAGGGGGIATVSETAVPSGGQLQVSVPHDLRFTVEIVLRTHPHDR